MHGRAVLEGGAALLADAGDRLGEFVAVAALLVRKEEAAGEFRRRWAERRLDRDAAGGIEDAIVEAERRELRVELRCRVNRLGRAVDADAAFDHLVIGDLGILTDLFQHRDAVMRQLEAALAAGEGARL